jgi:hypothetical protein
MVVAGGKTTFSKKRRRDRDGVARQTPALTHVHGGNMAEWKANYSHVDDKFSRMGPKSRQSTPKGRAGAGAVTARVTRFAGDCTAGGCTFAPRLA